MGLWASAKGWGCGDGFEGVVAVEAMGRGKGVGLQAGLSGRSKGWGCG